MIVGIRQRLANATLLTRFAVTSGLAMGVLGCVLMLVVRHEMRDREKASEARAVTEVTRAMLEERFGSAVSPQKMRRQAVRTVAALHRLHVVSLDLSDGGEGTVHAERGATHAATEDAVPFSIHLPRGLEAKGLIAQGATREDFDRDAETAGIVITSGLIVLYAVLFRIVAVASTNLRRHAELRETEALHDPLTSLPNRTNFRRYAAQALRSAGRDHMVAVMVMDLDRFKEVNDTLGHHHGDRLLQSAAERLASVVGSDGMIARFGGDEFAVLLPRIKSADAAVAKAATVTEALSQPYSVEGLTLRAGASIGIALAPEHGDDIETLLQRADVAMYVAKGNQSKYEFYASEDDVYDTRRLSLIGELQDAITDGHIMLLYQPKLDTRTGRVLSFEVLTRWHHDRFGVISPDEFIPLAEQTGLIGPLTTYILDRALHQCRTWHRAGFSVGVSVNLSLRHLIDQRLPDDTDRLLRRWGVSPGMLEYEITESTIMANPRRAMEVLSELSAMGVRLSVDDFGVGYSSLGHLRRLPVHRLKIDKSFVLDMLKTDGDHTVVRAMVELGHNVGLLVTAEGVEDRSTFLALRKLRCDEIQGYWIAKPMAGREVAPWMRRSAEWLASLSRGVEHGMTDVTSLRPAA
jgi:diguanylate cyclase